VAERADQFGSRLLIVAFEGWNDAGDAASGAVHTIRRHLDLRELASIDPELYFDFQFTRPTITSDEDGNRQLTWPGAVLLGPAPAEPAEKDERVSGMGASTLHLMIGSEPSRSWKAFAAELVDAALAAGVDGLLFVGAMLADVPHTRPLPVYASSENVEIREVLGLEKPSYEGPVGILSVLADAAEHAGIPTATLWASVPHYVHNAPSPKAMLAILEKIEQVTGLQIPRGDLVEEAVEWEAGVDALASEDEDMAAYINGLEQARDTVDSPDASGEAIALEFERYLRRRGDGRAEDPRRGS
jgi:hypothetical protein